MSDTEILDKLLQKGAIVRISKVGPPHGITRILVMTIFKGNSYRGIGDNMREAIRASLDFMEQSGVLDGT